MGDIKQKLLKDLALNNEIGVVWLKQCKFLVKTS